ncbi:G-protein coupled receptor 4-like [Channa argus]|uniref:G-protein coupled receptor 4-like n=1 Tax=Channa argus TaxID=215402 RepID=UPI0035225F03
MHHLPAHSDSHDLPISLLAQAYHECALGNPECLSIGASTSMPLSKSHYFLIQVRNDHVVPIYIINLLISDLIQICSTTAELAKPEKSLVEYSSVIYLVSVTANIGFMVCVSLERYLVIAWPLWYRFKRNIKVSLLVCLIVWLFPLAPALLGTLTSFNKNTIFAIFFLLPFPVLIFSVFGTLKSLSSAISVSSEEKQRIVGTLVVVLFNYTVFFLPLIVCLISLSHTNTVDSVLLVLSRIFIRISPLADLGLYIFMGKGAREKLIAFLCSFRKDAQQQTSGLHGVSVSR